MKPNFEAAANVPEPESDAFVTIHHILNLH